MLMRKLTRYVAVWAVATAITVIVVMTAPESVSLEVYPRVSFEPATVRIKIIIPKDEAHAFYCIALVGDNYDTTSCVQLGGSKDARVRQREFRDLPAGRYTVVLDIQTSDGRNKQARDRFRVLGKGMTVDPEDPEGGI